MANYLHNCYVRSKCEQAPISPSLTIIDNFSLFENTPTARDRVSGGASNTVPEIVRSDDFWHTTKILTGLGWYDILPLLKVGH